MPAGICYKSECATIFLVDSGSPCTYCTGCGATNISANAVARWEAAGPRVASTPDPKMTAASAQPSDPATAFKSDGGKVRFELLEDGCPNALLLIAKVMTWAVEVKGYHAHSWREVPEASRRYRAALARHRNAIARGELLDPESGYPHWAHVACCTIFLLELEIDHAQSV